MSWRYWGASVGLLATVCLSATDELMLDDRATLYLSELVRLDTANPPGNETRVADYLRNTLTKYGVVSESLGSDPRRFNFIARIKGNGKGGRPLLLFSQADTAPVDRTQWGTIDPFSGKVKDGFVYGAGSRSGKALLAAELAVFSEIKRRNIQLGRDLILCVEADGAGSTGMQWLMQNHWSKIDAEFALGEGGYSFEADGRKVHLVQTAEKLPIRIVLTTKGGNAGPRQEGPISRLSRAIIRLNEAEPSVRLSPVTRQYFRELAKVSGNEWLTPLLARMENPATAVAAMREMKARNAAFSELVHDTIQPLSIRGSSRGANAGAEAVVEVRRLPGLTREEMMSRLRAAIGDAGVEVAIAPGQQVPGAEASSVSSRPFRSMQSLLARMHPEDIIAPYISARPTGNAYLRSRGVGVYGLPLFGEIGDTGPDEKLAIRRLHDGVELLWQIVLEIAGDSGTKT
ncbi:peptidase M20 [Bryobacterales bacterium F-183]|nr:peptidase M20 [Bryobacterales bacterium F-183]